MPTPLQERRNPLTPAWMECPRCRESNGWIVDDDCPCCHGEGRVRLGPAALSIYEPDVVAKAVGMVHDRNRDNLAAAFEDLATAGIVKKQKRLPVEPEPEPVKLEPLPPEPSQYARGCEQLAMDVTAKPEPFKAKRPVLRGKGRRRRR